MSKQVVTAALAGTFALSASSSFAQPAPTAVVPAPSAYEPAPADATQAPALVPVAPLPAPVTDSPDVERARFSGKRLAVEIAGGELVSLLVSAGAFSAMCSQGSDCTGAAFGAFGVDFAITPAAIWLGGKLMGGEGGLGWTYLGASTSLAAFSVSGTPDESPADATARLNTEMTVSALLMPVTSALLYELSSQRWFAMHHTSFALKPVADHGRTSGALGGVTVAF